MHKNYPNSSEEMVYRGCCNNCSCGKCCGIASLIILILLIILAAGGSIYYYEIKCDFTCLQCGTGEEIWQILKDPASGEFFNSKCTKCNDEYKFFSPDHKRCLAQCPVFEKCTNAHETDTDDVDSSGENLIITPIDGEEKLPDK